MAEKELTKWLKFAVRLEQKGIDFYSKILEKAEDRHVKELFSFLVKAEKQHKAQFTKMLERIKGTDEKGLEKDVKQYLKTKQKVPIFKEKDLGYMEKRKSSLVKMFNKSIAFEMEGMRYYEDCMKKTEDRKLKEFFKKLANEELKHKQAIERLGFSLVGIIVNDAPM